MDKNYENPIADKAVDIFLAKIKDPEAKKEYDRKARETIKAGYYAWREKRTITL